MDNEQRLELHEEIKNYLVNALTLSVVTKNTGRNTVKVEVGIELNGEYITSDTFEVKQ